MPITVLKNNVPWGPFTRAQIQDGLARGDFNLEFLAHGPGLKEWLPLGQVLEHFDQGTSLPPVPGARHMVPAPEPHLPPRAVIALPQPLTPAPAKMAIPPPMPIAAVAPAAPPPSASIPPTKAVEARPVEQPRAPLKAAAFFPRFLAFAIDCGVLFLPVIFIFGLAALAVQVQGWIEHTDAETMRQGWALWQKNFLNVLGLVALGGAWIYAAALECSRWQATVGKQWIGMKVVDRHGERLSFLRATGRHAAKFLSALPLFLGFTMALFSSERLALHDRLAGTRVVKK